MSNTKAEVYAGLYEAAVKATVSAAEKVPESHRMRQVQDGKAHPVWLIGHLAHGLNLFVNQWALGGASCCPDEYAPMFAPGVAGGKPVSSNASDYPSWDELLENYKKAGAATVDLIRSLDDGELAGELKGPIPDAARGFFGNLEQTLLGMGTHDAYHRGQLGMIAALS